MKYIYYPEYEMENINIVNNINHIVNIKLLLFISDKIILPASHLLRTSIDNLIDSQKLKPFIDDNKIILSINDRNKNIQEYYNDKMYSIDNNIKITLKGQVNYICNNLFTNTGENYHKRQYSGLLFVFHKSFDDYITRDIQLASNRTYKDILNEIKEKVNVYCNYTGKMITYDELLNVTSKYFAENESKKYYKGKIKKNIRVVILFLWGFYVRYCNIIQRFFQGSKFSE